MLSLFTSTLLLALTSTVAGHGFLANVEIGSTNFAGNFPNANPKPSIIRQINDVSPVKGANNPEVNCGHDAQFAQNLGDAKPGDVVNWDWKGGDGSNWPHNIGPMLTYMTKCGDDSTSCSQFNSSAAKWFKIDQVGKYPNGKWVQADMFAGNTVQVTLPTSLPAGAYLIRHEIIALHIATSVGGAEFYPACAQINLAAPASTPVSPTDDELVLLPGAYSDKDAGIFTPNVFDTSAPYSFPGPPIAKLALTTASNTTSTGTTLSFGTGTTASPSSGSSSTGSKPPSASSLPSTSGSSSSSSSGSNSPAGSTKGKASSGKCTLTSQKAAYKKRSLSLHPKRYSRIFRDLDIILASM